MHVGTSGWSYPHWRTAFYPTGLPAGRWLSHYAGLFDTVEVNATFYRLPSSAAVERWRDTVPSGFRFAVKGSRLITHARRLQGAEAATETFLERVGLLGDRLGCVLWQLPPGVVPGLDVLDRFLARLPRTCGHALELREPDRPPPPVLDLLERHGVAAVCTSSVRDPLSMPLTADLVYVRFHGLAGGWAHDYTDDELAPWAAFLVEAARAGRTVLAYFNNDGGARAPANALRLRQALAEAAAGSASQARVASTAARAWRS